MEESGGEVERCRGGEEESGGEEEGAERWRRGGKEKGAERRSVESG